MIGGISVLTHLNPFVVALHLLVSMVLIGLASWLVRPHRVIGSPAVRHRGGRRVHLRGHVGGGLAGHRLATAAARTPAT